MAFCLWGYTVMKKLILGIAVYSVGIVSEVVGMNGDVVNPVNTIVEYYDAVTPQRAVDDFQKSAEKLLQDIDSAKTQYEDNGLLRTKWETGISVLKNIFSVDRSSQSDLEKLFTRVCDITDNGFYDVSNTIITIDSSKRTLKPLFERFWQLLLQEREIAAWWVCADPRVSVEEIPYLCFDACGLIESSEVNNILWSISILGNVSQAIQELNESGEPSDIEIMKAKKDAKEILENALKKIPSLGKSSLKHFIEAN